MSQAIIFTIGFIAQACFSARILVQWLKSEKSKKVESPLMFWIFSIAGSYLFFFYGWMRDDFSIILGQFISYYIYMWNLKQKGIWEGKLRWLRYLFMATPVVVASFMLKDAGKVLDNFFANENIPLWLVVFGSAGQVIFTLRFVYQYFYSRKQGESLLPRGFWVISFVGSLTIIVYGLIRLDPVLILGQSVGFIAYTRNLVIGNKEKRGK